jgi:hypothetical protein
MAYAGHEPWSMSRIPPHGAASARLKFEWGKHRGALVVGQGGQTAQLHHRVGARPRQRQASGHPFPVYLCGQEPGASNLLSKKWAVK